MAEGASQVERNAELVRGAFDTSFLGIESSSPVLRSMDWLEKHRDDAHLVNSMREYLSKGVRSRKQRFGELGGRALSGYWREPQDEIHVHVPAVVLGGTVAGSPQENWQRVFTSPALSKAGYTHRLFVLLDSGSARTDSYKQRFQVIPDTVPVEERIPKAFFIRSELFSDKTLSAIQSLVREHGVPLVDIASLTRM